MCGVLGIATSRRFRLDCTDASICQLRDRMIHRGPDDAGLWRNDHIALAHRRLAILDLTDAARQPMVSPSGRFVLVYNGELYNEADLKSRLLREGVEFHTSCDTETVLAWLSRHGPAAIKDFRGMYALGLYDTVEHTLLLARDPLGIKPMFYWTGTMGNTPLLIFASEVQAILAHPAVKATPNMVTVSAYLTTIRTTLGRLTMYEGVSTLLPGESLLFDLSGTTAEAFPRQVSHEPSTMECVTPEEVAAIEDMDETSLVVRTIEDSVQQHLRADVPVCALLSGGLDSAIITTIASQWHDHLRTYCAGATETPPDESSADHTHDDMYYASMLAGMLGVQHDQARIDRRLFVDRWQWIISRKQLPMSTPNEVAIYEVARLLGNDGHRVTLSGEGADELFGGYDQPLNFAAQALEAGNMDPALLQLHAGAWCPLASKVEILSAGTWDDAEHDERLLETYRNEFARVARGAEPLDDQLAMQQRINLAGLLDRLDSSTMLASVEGRTPLADVYVAAIARGLPMARKCVLPDRTKIALREAFAGRLPKAIVRRPKASFPLPFRAWLEDATPWIARSAFLDEILRPEVKALIAARSGEYWRLAWPIANLALWAEQF